MKSFIYRTVTPISISIAIALFLMASLSFVMNRVTHAQSDQSSSRGRLITIYDRGTTKVVLTQAPTVGDALHQAGITLAKEDVVEPAANEKLVASEYKVNIYRARPVIVVDGAIRQKIMTPYQTAQQIASSTGITLYPEDTTKITRVDDLIEGAGLQLTIDRATPLTFVLYGKTTTIRTQAKTVAELLKSEKITLAADDTLSVPQSQVITADMNVQLWRNGTQTMNVDQPIAYDTQIINNADQPTSYSAVQTQGANGTRTVTYQIDMKNGIEVSRTQIQSVVITQPTTQVEVHGTKLALSAGYLAQRIDIMSQAGISSSDYGYVAFIIDHENGMWCPTRWQGQSVCTADYQALHSPDSQVGYGLCQATPGNKMATAGSDWQTNPVTQMKWCSSYAISRYGSWSGAYSYWVNHHNW